MAKVLTAAAIARFRPGRKRREIPDGGCRGLHLIIQASGIQSWAYRYRRPSGTPAKLTLGRVDLSGREVAGEVKIGDPLSLAAARALCAEVERQRRRGRDPAADHIAEKEKARVVAAEAAARTFAACARQFVDEHEVNGRQPRGWREGYARILGLDYPKEGGEPMLIKGGMAERWRERPVGEIDGGDVYAVIDESRRRGIPGMVARNRGISDSRGRKMSDALGAMFAWLLQHRRVATNPMTGMWRPPSPAARHRVLNTKIDVRGADELRWFWSACAEVGDPFAGAFKLLLLTGCRRDEIAELRWSELSDDFSMLRLPGERTKNGRPHDLALPPMARDIIANVRRIEGPWVFTFSGRTPATNYVWAKKKLDDIMGRLAREGGATIEPWRIHDLRRSAATGMADLGIQPHVVEAALNHLSGAKAGIAGTYNRAEYADEKKAALERWASHIHGVVSGQPAKVLSIRARS